MTKPGGSHHRHRHTNSIISGVFYIATVENDKIYFHDPNILIKDRLEFKIRKYNQYNSKSWFFEIDALDLILFPSWLEHNVMHNVNQTTDRISLSFNTFAKGDFGEEDRLNKLII